MSAGSILLVDDEDAIRECTSRQLRVQGYDCQCAKDGEEAVQHLKRQRYDVLVADVLMPHNPNLYVVSEARRLDRHLPVILVSGYPSADTAIRGIELSVSAYLMKPFEIEELLSHVRKLIAQSQLRRRLSIVSERLQTVMSDLETSDRAGPVPAFIADAHRGLGSIRTLASCLSDLLTIWDESAGGKGQTNLCTLLDCPQKPVHRDAIVDAIEVLERTKENFRSKQLGDLRMRLENNLQRE